MYIRGSLLKLRLWLELLAFEASEHCCAVVVRLARGPDQLEWRLAFRGNYFSRRYWQDGVMDLRATTCSKHDTQYIYSYVHNTKAF